MQVKATTRRKFIELKIDGKDARLQYDTGADVTIVSKGFWEEVLCKPPLDPTNDTAIAAGGN